ncbi:hypothetical protein GPJ56_004189 [Histomonas meleagridis]|uniref:uncharacterized protein n=1 Tax=Histomonas meleagridis TaxID=135588 RepID=UPI003559ABD6|nr:hypothetical protein GPJ56_004189 [Histomonas meleagridis]KAH0801531.1 hypothetical protein GO595_005667 [Histomonas meleagridis]
MCNIPFTPIKAISDASAITFPFTSNSGLSKFSRQQTTGPPVAIPIENLKLSPNSSLIFLLTSTPKSTNSLQCASLMNSSLNIPEITLKVLPNPSIKFIVDLLRDNS